MGCNEQAGPFIWSQFASNTKKFSHGYDTFSTVSDMLVNKKELELHICKKDDGWFYKYAFYNVSMKRRNEIKNVLNFRYRKTASSEIPVTDHLIGDNCVSKPKVMGNITKQPIGKKSNLDAKFKKCISGKNLHGKSRVSTHPNPIQGQKPPVFFVPFPESRGSKGTFPVQKCNENAVQLQQVKVRKLEKPYWKKLQKMNGY